MNWQLRRGAGGPPRRALMLSLALHGGVLVLLTLSSVFAPEPLDFVTYRIELVAMPAERAPETQPEPETAELVVETPEATPPAPEPDPVPPPPTEEARPEPPKPEPDPKPQPERQPEARPEPRPAETPTPRRTDPEASDEPAERAASDVNVRLEGLRRDYPAYYEHIIGTIQRCFLPPSGVPAVTAVVQFEIRRDGTVSGVRVVQRSGIPAFDLAALAAIGDCAGRQGRLGPLPEDLPYDRLPIQFTFRPRGVRDAPDPLTR